jgi:ABC-type branched-subunit amino acid transport system ATPase component
MSGELLEVTGLNKSFGGVAAITDCSFAVAEGQVTGLIGPNGAGKSTVIDMVSGFGRADSGSIVFAGADITGMRPDRIARHGLIRTFQLPREWHGLTVLDNVLLALCRYQRESLWRSVAAARPMRRAEREDISAAKQILDRFQLSKLAGERAGTLSGGQKRLLEFARIAAASPRMVILDEPMGGVNPVIGGAMAQALREFARSGQTVLVVEHNLPFIERTCDQVIVMDAGEVIATGPFGSLRSDPRVVDAYLGMDAVG